MRAAEVLVEILLDRGAVEIDTDFHIVLVQLPREVVEDLVIAVETMTRNAAGRTELGKSANQRRCGKPESKGDVPLH